MLLLLGLLELLLLLLLHSRALRWEAQGAQPPFQKQHIQASRCGCQALLHLWQHPLPFC